MAIGNEDVRSSKYSEFKNGLYKQFGVSKSFSRNPCQLSTYSLLTKILFPSHDYHKGGGDKYNYLTSAASLEEVVNREVG